MRGVKVKLPGSSSSLKSAFSIRKVVQLCSDSLIHAGVEHILHQSELSLDADQRPVPESYHAPQGVGERDKRCTGTDRLFKGGSYDEFRGVPGKEIPDR